MPAPAADKAGTDKADKPDTGEATTSTSATDASTTEGRAAAGQPATGAAGQSQPGDVTRVVVEQPAPEPAVLYGEDAQQPAPRDHVKAKYEPFEW